MKDFTTDKQLMGSYLDYDVELRIKRLKIIILLGAFFVMVFGLLDFLVYPDIATKMMLARMIAIAVLLLSFLVLAMEWFEKVNHIKILGLFAPFTVFALIDVLVFMSDGISSPYYGGLILTMVTLSTLYVWTFYEMLVACLVMLASYLLTSVLYIKMNDVSSYEYAIFINNLFFLISVGFFCSVSAYLNTKLRFKEFCLNYELEKSLIVSKDQLKTSLEDVRDFQKKLVQSEKLNSIGSLSASVIHEVNNPLNYTLIALNFLRENDLVEKNEDLKDIVSDIEIGMGRINEIVKEFRDFARIDGSDKKSRFVLGEAVNSALRFTVYESKGIEVRNNVDVDIKVIGSETHITQVIINLISNSCKAIGKASKGNGLIIVESKLCDGRVQVYIKDNGVGVSKDKLDKIFDVFFTTNEVGKGTGLGLNICSRIIQSHGGKLTVESEVGKGSVFSFDLEIG